MLVGVRVVQHESCCCHQVATVPALMLVCHLASKEHLTMVDRSSATFALAGQRFQRNGDIFFHAHRLMPRASAERRARSIAAPFGGRSPCSSIALCGGRAAWSSALLIYGGAWRRLRRAAGFLCHPARDGLGSLTHSTLFTICPFRSSAICEATKLRRPVPVLAKSSNFALLTALPYGSLAQMESESSNSLQGAERPVAAVAPSPGLPLLTLRRPSRVHGEADFSEAAAATLFHGTPATIGT